MDIIFQGRSSPIARFPRFQQAFVDQARDIFGKNLDPRDVAARGATLAVHARAMGAA